MEDRTMLSQKMEKALNSQINKEFYSSYLYLAMASYFEAANLRGMAKWMRVQAMEESAHAMIIYHYVIERGGTVRLDALAAPGGDFASPVEVFQQALDHERTVTASIYSLMAAAQEERDFASQSMLNWFVDEQVEEEANATEVIEQLKMAGDKSGLLFLDSSLGQRTFVTPQPLAGKM